MLRQYGELDTSTIYGKLNDTRSGFGLRSGCTTASLNNILGKEPVFIKTRSCYDDDAPRCLGSINGTYRVSSWKLNEPLLATHPELADYSTNSYQLKGRMKKC